MDYLQVSLAILGAFLCGGAVGFSILFLRARAQHKKVLEDAAIKAGLGALRALSRREDDDPRDLGKPPPGKEDPIVAIHIREAVEMLTDHVDLPTLEAYEEFLKGELKWIAEEKAFRRVMTKRP